jgi:hypothetical protein
VYASALEPDLMREKKRAAFTAMRASFARLTAGWGGRAPFETWFDGDLNNAHLASVATYFACVPGFERELKAAGGNLTAFYARVRALARLDQTERDALLCGAADAGSNGINSAAFVQQGQLERKADGEHDGDGEQPLCEPFNEIDLVHDVLRIAFVPGDGQIAPCFHPQQTQSLTAD